MKINEALSNVGKNIARKEWNEHKDSGTFFISLHKITEYDDCELYIHFKPENDSSIRTDKRLSRLDLLSDDWYIVTWMG